MKHKTPIRTSKRPMCHLLLVDDDPVFRKRLRAEALDRGIAVMEAGSRSEIGNVAIPGAFDVAIVDYFLDGELSGFTGTRVAHELGRTPTLLISHSERCLGEGGSWPSSIRGFCSKSKGIPEILDAALALAER